MTIHSGRIPTLSFGTFANVLVEGETYAAVLAALDTVYRHLDCIGAALKKWFSMNPSVEREDLHHDEIYWQFACAKTEENKVKLGPDDKYIIKKSLTEDIESTWRAMENFTNQISGREAMLRYAAIESMMSQVEIHPFLPNTELVEYCFSQDILLAAYSPLGRQGQVETTQETLLQNAELAALAEKKGVTLAQLLIAWGRRGVVIFGYDVWPEESS
ncbi:NADP-dependent oxidoreductase domain-containing protein [Hyaloscypha finlandica]|nr:NADP-dependent oxidoreductase domain-containing protein [Hyaloscypha finlandica]